MTSKGAKEIVLNAKLKNVTINWFTQSNFQVALNQPSNLDLAQLYFGIGDEHGFIRSNISVTDSTFIQSKLFLELPIIKLPGRQPIDLELRRKLSLLTGNPGSGKTILVKHLFCKYAKLFESRKSFDKNITLPMLVNLKDCYSENL